MIRHDKFYKISNKVLIIIRYINYIEINIYKNIKPQIFLKSKIQ